MLGAEQIVDIKYLKRQGLNISQIARRVGVCRKTVRKYLNSPEQARRPQKRSSILDPYKPYIHHRLSRFPELTARRLFREIRDRECPDQADSRRLPETRYTGSERTVRRHVARVRPRKERVYRPVETLPGEQAQVDWGHAGTITLNGQQHTLYVFTLVLSYSRIRYVEYTISQDMVTFLGCHQRALEYLGGVPLKLLYDNCKTVVISRVGAAIQFNQDLMRFAARYGFKPDACWMHDPESKGKVENSIQYVGRDFLYARPLPDSLATLNQQALKWCDEVANQQEHQSTREIPADRLAAERKALGPLPERPVKVFTHTTRQLRKDATFTFETNQYSVPHAYARQQAVLQVFKDRLEVYVGRDQVAVHTRCHERGQLVLSADHYADRPRGPRTRMSRLQKQFEAIGPVAADFLKGLARQRHGQLREQVKRLLALVAEHGPDTVHAAMQRAHHFGRYRYGAVKRIINKQKAHPQALPDDPKHRSGDASYQGPDIDVDVRSPAHYAQFVEVGS
jgi:transposase